MRLMGNGSENSTVDDGYASENGRDGGGCEYKARNAVYNSAVRR